MLQEGFERNRFSSDGRKAGMGAGRSLRRRSFADDAAGQVARRVVILDDVDGSAFSRVAFDQCQSAVRTKGFDSLGPAVEIVVVNLALKNSMRVLLDEVGFAVVVAVVRDFDDLVVPDRLDDVGLAVPVCIYSKLIFVRSDPADPLIRPAVSIAVSDSTGGIAAARGKRESQRGE